MERDADAGIETVGCAEMRNGDEKRNEEDRREEPRFHGAECEEIGVGWQARKTRMTAGLRMQRDPAMDFA